MLSARATWVINDQKVKFSIPENADDEQFLSGMLKDHAKPPESWEEIDVKYVTVASNVCL